MKCERSYNSEVSPGGTNVLALGDGLIGNLHIRSGHTGDPMPVLVRLTREKTDVVQAYLNGQDQDGLLLVLQLREPLLSEQLESFGKTIGQLIQDHHDLLVEHQKLRDRLAAMKGR